MVEFEILPEGQVLSNFQVYTNEGGGLMETMAENMVAYKPEEIELKKQFLANMLATYKELKIEVFPQELEAIRRYFKI